MKFLLDENLSPRLVAALALEFPGSVHVRNLGLERADDATIWDLARRDGFTILSKDADFHQLSFLHGHPPKVIWLRVGNCSTQQILRILQDHVADLQAFDANPETSFLVLS